MKMTSNPNIQSQGYCNRLCPNFKTPLFEPNFCNYEGKVYRKKGSLCLYSEATAQELEKAKQAENMNQDHDIYTSTKQSTKRESKPSLLQRILLGFKDSFQNQANSLKHRPPTG